ncbi:MAG: response regulator [Desulfobacterales bacterium]
MSLNVLIVDDSSVMRAMIAKTLQMTELQIGELHQAGDGLEGIETLKNHWVDLVIADINMPVMNGEEMLKKMADDPELSPIPVIVVSTEGSETRIDRIRKLGARFIHKPFTPEQFRDAIVEMTGLGGEGND